ncbi:DUF998 domain-containing protein [Pseudoxanthomonas suwonensis]|uniref:DUF998 domain-containing protein n=1 Tax=Pseudoxanthomonas suwonensis TaxID=314722 RepID=A0A0E3Z0B4_9GAMM|nr:DUF998 domain-containing protein [Pseudoxanthomonas suwonensis]AKC85938.1 hypothetical protein WQ53_03335 [Pseudoxanthomonas suwonensis]
MNLAARFLTPAALAAVASFVLAAVLAGLATDGYSHLRHPLALLGARQLETAGTLFGLFAFVLPGLAGAWIALALRQRLPADSGWLLRVGAQLALLGALAFAAQGLLPLDMEALDAGASRWHATAWLVWALAFPLGALLLAAGLWRAAGWRRFAVLTALAGALVVAGGFLGADWVGAALAQRIAFAAWLGWGVLAAAAPLRRDV